MLHELEATPLGLPSGLELEWLGVAGYRITYENISLLVDPYVSRVPLRSLLLRRPALPDDTALARYVRPPGPVAGILIGHTHWDHAVDAPALARRFGATPPADATPDLRVPDMATLAALAVPA